MKKCKTISRRSFLESGVAASAALAAPVIIPSSTLGADGAVAPSERINMAIIGCGNQGSGELGNWLNDKRVQVVAVCDVNQESATYWAGRLGGREPARRRIEEHYAQLASSGHYSGCASYEDFRHIAHDRPDIDAVYIGVPDHWHALLAISMARAGKDIYGQKPLSLTIRDGRAMVEAVKRYGCVWQTGSQQRSDSRMRRACELVRNGLIGRLHTVRCGLPGGTPDYSGGKNIDTNPGPVPAGFNYNFWLGPAPWEPYCPARCHVNFRWITDYSGGQLTDWGGHHPDIAQWGMDTEHTGPIAIRNARAQFAKGPLWNTATDYYFEAHYESGVKMIVSNKVRGGVTFEGSEGTIYTNRGYLNADPPSILDTFIGPDGIHLYESRNHFRNFIDCVLTRRETVAPIETGHRSITIAHLGNIAFQTGRDINWNPEKEEIIGDPSANALLGRAYRAPWNL